MRRPIQESMPVPVGAINTTPPRRRLPVTVSALAVFLVMVLIASVFTPSFPAYANEVDTTINTTDTGDDDSPLVTVNAQDDDPEQVPEANPLDLSEVSYETVPLDGPNVDDVRVHDELVDDTAFVSRLEVEKVASGTAPWDADNARGNDSSPDNNVVRSWDHVVYDIGFTMSADADANGLVMDYYRKARVGFEFLLPADSVGYANATWIDKDQMAWMDTTEGYAPVESTVQVNGREYVSFVCYRVVEADDTMSHVVPGSSMVKFVVKVGAAAHGYEFAPLVRAWMAPDTNRKRQVECAGKTLTVSARLSVNLRVAVWGNFRQSSYDFSKGSADTLSGQEPLSKDAGTVQGAYHSIGVEAQLRWPDRSKGMRGLEVPTGEFSYDLHVSNTMYDSNKPNPVKRVEEAWQPLLWQLGRGWWGNRTYFGVDQGTVCQPTANTKPLNNGVNSPARNKTYVSQERSDEGSLIKVKVDRYDVTSGIFPTTPNETQHGKRSTVYMDASLTELQVAAFHVGFYHFVTPVALNGVSASQLFGADQSMTITGMVNNLRMTSVSGQQLDIVTDNTNQAVTTDDKGAATTNMLVPGMWQQVVRYSCGSEDFRTGVNAPKSPCVDGLGDEWSPNGIDGNWQNNPGWSSNGQDQRQRGGKFDITAGQRLILGSDLATWPATQLTLVKYDPTVIEPRWTETRPDTFMYAKTLGARSWNGGNMVWLNQKNSTGVNQNVYWLWAVKKDGTSWANVAESKAASYNDLEFYDTYNEASKHGTVVGAAYAVPALFHSTTTIGNTRIVSAMLRMKVRADAQVHSTAVMTAETHAWTRGDLASYTGVNPYDANSKWLSALSQLNGTRDVLDKLVGTVNASYHTRGGDLYQEAQYDKYGTYLGGDSANYYYGDTLLVTNEEVSVGKQVAQQVNGNPKTVFDLDRGERTVDWKLTTISESIVDRGITDITLTDTLPKGLTYVPGSSYVGGTYKENTPAQGSNTGGVNLEPERVTANKDGTTTVVWILSGVAFNERQTLIYSATIGDMFDQNNDVANLDSFANKVTVQSSGDKGLTSKYTNRIATASMMVSKLNANAIATKADPLLNELTDVIGYTSRLSNTGKNAQQNALAVQVLPDTRAGSRYSGTYTVRSLQVAGLQGANLTGVRVYATVSADVPMMDYQDMSTSMLSSWTQLTVDKHGAVQIPDNIASSMTAWAVVLPSLAAGSVLQLDTRIQGDNNQAGDMYVARFTDSRTMVDAVAQVVSRAVNGIFWYDTNGDGVRNTDSMLLKGVRVRMTDASNTTIRSVNGKPLETTTDADGMFSLDALPAGRDYRLVFTPAANSNWNALRATVKDAPTATMATDSNADEQRDSTGKLTALQVMMPVLPSVQDMASNRYTVQYRNAGLTGAVYGTTSITATKTLEGRDWLDTDVFTANVTPLMGAPKNALPQSVTFTRDTTDTAISIDLNAFPRDGVYQYLVKETESAIPGVTDDPTGWVIKVTVTSDWTAFTRSATVTASYNQSDPQDSIQFVNTYKPKATTTSITVEKQWVDETGTPVNNPHVNEIGFQLYEKRDTGTERLVGEYTLDKANGWRTSITGLPLSETGSYAYRVEETNPNDPHITVVEGHGLVTVTVTDNQRDGRLEAVADNTRVLLVNQVDTNMAVSMMPSTGQITLLAMVLMMVLTGGVLMWRRVRS